MALSHTGLFYEGALDMKLHITNEVHSAELVMIISYPASLSRIIIVLLKTLRFIIENLTKKMNKRNAAQRKPKEDSHFLI